MMALRLYHATGNHSYHDWALKAGSWFVNSGMVNNKYLVNDGLTPDCKNNDQTEWTYNQGVVLGGLVGLSQITGNASLVEEAVRIAVLPQRVSYIHQEFFRKHARHQAATKTKSSSKGSSSATFGTSCPLCQRLPLHHWQTLSRKTLRVFGIKIAVPRGTLDSFGLDLHLLWERAALLFRRLLWKRLLASNPLKSFCLTYATRD